MESDEEFVVEEWDKKPPKPVQPEGEKKKLEPVNKKKRIRAIIIESDDDSIDSLPNINSDTDNKAEIKLVKKVKVEEVTTLQKVSPKPVSDSVEVKKEKSTDSIKEEKSSLSKVKTEADASRKSEDQSIGDKKSIKSKEDKDRDRSRHSSGSSSSSSKKSSKDKDRHRSESDKKRDRDYDRKSSSDRDRKYYDKEREKRREKERKERREREQQQEKDKSTMDKILKPLKTDGMAKIPKKPPSFMDALGSADPSRGSSGESQIKKPPIKVKSSNFRSTGLLDSTAAKGPGIAGKRTTGGSGSLPANSSGLKLNDKYGGNKRPLDDQSASSSDKRFKSAQMGDRPGGIKLISPKRRKYSGTAPTSNGVSYSHPFPNQSVVSALCCKAWFVTSF